MARALVAYASSEGQTASIAERIGDVLEEAGHEATLVNATHPPAGFSPAEYDGALVAASVHKGRHQRSITRLVTDHREVLDRLPSAFVSVSLTAATGPDRPEPREYVTEFLEETGWDPDLSHVVAGALKYRKYGLLNRFVMKQIARSEGMSTDTTRDHEYTDWADVEAFAREFAAHLSDADVAASR